tara:strand:- start:216 stop:323 length:108 start_codon:yes stop_codon:yes gene_type:complete
MNNKAFTERDLLKWIAIIAGLATVYFIIKAVTSSL